MRNFLHSIVHLSGVLNDFVGRTLAWLLPMMTAVSLTVIICAAVFRAGWVWLGELTVYMHAMLLMLGAAYTLRADGHVRIDIFYSRMSPRGQAWVNLGGSLFLLTPICLFILYYSLPYVASSWRVLEVSPEGEGLPAVFLLKTCMPLAVALLLLEGLSLAAKSLLTLLPPKSA